MSMGIPAVAIGRARGDKGGRNHSLDEWVDVDEDSSVEAAQIIMLTILAAAGAGSQ
jgi:hypothetical protein